MGVLSGTAGYWGYFRVHNSRVSRYPVPCRTVGYCEAQGQGPGGGVLRSTGGADRYCKVP